MFKSAHHVHYAVKDLDAMMNYLEKNFGMKPDMDLASAHGIWLQLAEGARKVKR